MRTEDYNRYGSQGQRGTHVDAIALSAQGDSTHGAECAKHIFDELQAEVVQEERKEPVRLTHRQLLDHLQGQIGVGKRYRTQAEAAAAWGGVSEVYISGILGGAEWVKPIGSKFLKKAGFRTVVMYEPIEETKEQG